MGVPGGPSDVFGNAWGALWASLWVCVTFLGVPGGSCGGPWGSWSCSCQALGVARALLGGSWGSLEGPLGAPWATLWETKCVRRYAYACFSVSYVFMCFYLFFVVFVILFCFVLCLFSPWGSGSCSWEALRVPKASLRVFWVPWEVLGSSWGVLGDSLKVHEGQIQYIYEAFE